MTRPIWPLRMGVSKFYDVLIIDRESLWGDIAIASDPTVWSFVYPDLTGDCAVVPAGGCAATTIFVES